MMDSITTDLRHVTGSNGPFSTSADSTAKTSIRDSQLYRRILGQSLGQVGLSNEHWEETEGVSGIGTVPRHLVPPQSAHRSPYPGIKVRGLSDEENENLVRQVAEVAATAVAAATRDVTRSQRRTSASAQASSSKQDHRPPNLRSATATEGAEEIGHVVEASHAAAGGHDAPNWSKMKSSIVLLVATLAYAVIAEILVNTVDVVLDSVDIDEKFLGITLFALVPNTTEFLVSCSALSP
jgi:Ca2+:H+ antiporter